jgi:four helix bundle protein
VPLRIGSNIAERLEALALTAIKASAQLPRNPAARRIGVQLVDAITSAGANYEEARAAESRSDFIHKVSVAAKEARESAYWLGLIGRSEWKTIDLAPAVREANELAAILAASARTARARAEGA